MNRPTLQILLSLTLLLCAGISATAAAHAQEAQKTPPAAASQANTVGHITARYESGKPAWVGKSPEDVQKYHEFARGKDPAYQNADRSVSADFEGQYRQLKPQVEKLIKERGLFTVAFGTEAKRLARKNLPPGLDVYKVLILTGPYKGQQVWTVGFASKFRTK